MKSTLRTDFSEVKSVFGFRVRLGNPDLDFENLNPDFPIKRTLRGLLTKYSDLYEILSRARFIAWNGKVECRKVYELLTVAYLPSLAWGGGSNPLRWSMDG